MEEPKKSIRMNSWKYWSKLIHLFNSLDFIVTSNMCHYSLSHTFRMKSNTNCSLEPYLQDRVAWWGRACLQQRWRRCWGCTWHCFCWADQTGSGLLCACVWWRWRRVRHARRLWSCARSRCGSQLSSSGTREVARPWPTLSLDCLSPRLWCLESRKIKWNQTIFI